MTGAKPCHWTACNQKEDRPATSADNVFIAVSNQFSAVFADRECDPDLCKPCQWTICNERERPASSVDCQNMSLRLRQHKRVAMGLSHIAGWGAFAQVTPVVIMQVRV